MHGCCTEFDILPHSWQNLLEWLQTRVSAVWIDSARFTGRPGWTRTSDPLLRRQVLYPPELRAHPLETKSIDGFIYVRGNADLGEIFGDPTEIRFSEASIASRRAFARMWEYGRNMAALTWPIISSIADSGTPASPELGAEATPEIV